MANAFDHENTPAAGYGEMGSEHWNFTDLDWAQYDAQVEAEMAEWDATQGDDWDAFIPEYDDDAPF